MLEKKMFLYMFISLFILGSYEYGWSSMVLYKIDLFFPLLFCYFGRSKVSTMVERMLLNVLWLLNS